MVFLNQFQYYGGGEGPMDYRAPQLYLTIIQNISIFVAFTGLLKFYHAVDQELAWCRPLPKFLCIKGVVFMTFWQGLVIAVLAEETSNDDSNAENWADSAQNFLICLEMLLFSIAHFYCFPTEEWQDGYRVQVSKGKFGDSLALNDFFTDIKLILRNNKRKTPKKKLKSTRQLGETESIPEEPQDLSERTESCGGIDAEEDNLLRALNASLGEDATDPEIAKATRRLLRSNVLSPTFFGSGGNVQSSPTSTDIENARRQLYGSQDDDCFDDDEEEEEGTDDEEEDEDEDDDEQNDVDEELGGSSSNSGSNHVPVLSHHDVESPFMEALRPSILQRLRRWPKWIVEPPNR
jgi:Organic solute transporter Ostalpha